MSGLSPTARLPIGKDAAPAQASPPASTVEASRQHRHRHHHHHDPSVSPDTTNTSKNNHNAASQANGPDQNPLAADNSHSSIASSQSRHRRSRRSTASHRIEAALDVLGDGAGSGLTVCCDGVSVQRHQRDVIDEVSCLFRGGRVTAVVNCCGTHSALALLAAVAGRVDCTAGNIVMSGVPVSASTYQAQMSFVEETDASTDDGGATSDLLVNLTVRENLAFASALRVANSAQAYSVEEMLQQLLLESHADARIRDCSLYVRRRVALGKELLLNPSVLLLDEPTDGLATHEAQQLLTILSKLAAPSTADAEARHVMREAMAASAAASLSAGAGVSAGVEAPLESSSSATSPPRTSLYTPRHSRVHPSRTTDAFTAVSPNASNTAVPAFAGAAGSPSDHSSASGRGSGVAAGGSGFGGVASGSETQRVIILSIVQPRWALLQYVHDVVLLERSRCVFAGSVQDMLSVKLPKTALRPRLSGGGNGGAREAGREAGDPHEDEREEEGADDPLELGTTQAGPLSIVEDAPAGSYDAVAASIHKTRLNEEFVHGLYRLATTSAATGGMVSSDFPEFGSFADRVDTTEPPLLPQRVVSPASAARHSRSSSLVAVRADGLYATPLSQLYAVQFGHARARVTAYMEVCAAGLLTLPEASHQSPAGIFQLLHLFRFGFVEIRHNLVWDVVGLVFVLMAAAALAALYGVQVGVRGIQNCAGILFFMVCCVVLQSVLSLDAQRREYASFYRYSRSGYYSAWTFLVYRAVTAALWRFGLCFFVALVVFVLSGFGDAWREYRGVFELGVGMAVLSYCSYFLIWFLCSWWPSDRVSRFIVFTFYTLNIVLAGLVLNLATLPAVVQGASFLSVMRLGYESAMLMSFADKTFGCVEASSSDDSASMAASALTQTSVALETAPVMSKGLHVHEKNRRHVRAQASFASATLSQQKCHTGAEYAAYLGFDPSRRWVDVGILAGLSAVLLLASLVMMALYRPRRRLKVTV